MGKALLCFGKNSAILPFKLHAAFSTYNVEFVTLIIRWTKLGG